MSKFIDLTNFKIGRLKVESIDYLKSKDKRIYWFVSCLCGPDKILKRSIRSDVLNFYIKNQMEPHCGCFYRNILLFSGKKINNLILINKEEIQNQKMNYWNCLCLLCDNQFLVNVSVLRKEKIKSCGCDRLKKLKEGSILSQKNKRNISINIFNEKQKKLKILKQIDISDTNMVKVEVLCQCGAIFISRIKEILNGDTKSCGCLKKKYFNVLINQLKEKGFFEGYIYKITNKINGKFYIGMTFWIKNRWNQHKKDLKYGMHHSWKFQKDFNENPDINNYKFEIIHTEIFDSLNFKNNILSEMENFFLIKNNPNLNVYLPKEYKNEA